ETAAIPTRKETALADATAMAQEPDAKPEPEAISPEPKQPDVVAAVPTPPAPSAPPKPAVDAAASQPTVTETAGPKISAPEPVSSEIEKPKVVARTQPERRTAPPPLEKAEESRLLAKGKGLSRSGDIASARLVYEHAATRGSAEAMYALAQTYDPRMLAQWEVIGIAPNPSLALEWYTRAARLGHDAADARAGELGQ
ncbi:MAG: hypothetical protein OEM91_02030, partial [Hyphomicrobiales bacterium]|nr:hypothetical protein [Hyphomicrobiales bacterium]